MCRQGKWSDELALITQGTELVERDDPPPPPPDKLPELPELPAAGMLGGLKLGVTDSFGAEVFLRGGPCAHSVVAGSRLFTLCIARDVYEREFGEVHERAPVI